MTQDSHDTRMHKNTSVRSFNMGSMSIKTCVAAGHAQEPGSSATYFDVLERMEVQARRNTHPPQAKPPVRSLGNGIGGRQAHITHPALVTQLARHVADPFRARRFQRHHDTLCLMSRSG